jgi:hypothetical protein
MATAEQRHAALRQAVDVLEAAVDALAASIGRPEWIADGDSGRFRYRDQSAQVLQIAKAVRAVSTLNACLHLLSVGYYAEILMLLRSAHDFIAEIMYIHEALQTGTPTADQQRFLEHFFAAYGSTTEDLIANPPRGSAVERKKITASQGRQMTPENPHRTQKMFAAVEGVFAGYTHGSYSSAMELYEGGTWRFRMRGMAGTPRALDQIVIYTHRAFNAVRGIAWSTRTESVFNSIKLDRIAFEQSPACEGMQLSVDAPTDGSGP